jgi:hypothetical protein
MIIGNFHLNALRSRYRLLPEETASNPGQATMQVSHSYGHNIT